MGSIITIPLERLEALSSKFRATEGEANASTFNPERNVLCGIIIDGSTIPIQLGQKIVDQGGAVIRRGNHPQVVAIVLPKI